MKYLLCIRNTYFINKNLFIFYQFKSLFSIMYILIIYIFIFIYLFFFIKNAIKIYLRCIIFKIQSIFNNIILLYALFHLQLIVIICIIIIFSFLFYLIDFYFLWDHHLSSKCVSFFHNWYLKCSIWNIKKLQLFFINYF